MTARASTRKHTHAHGLVHAWMDAYKNTCIAAGLHHGRCGQGPREPDGAVGGGTSACRRLHNQHRRHDAGLFKRPLRRAVAPRAGKPRARAIQRALLFQSAVCHRLQASHYVGSARVRHRQLGRVPSKALRGRLFRCGQGGADRSVPKYQRVSRSLPRVRQSRRSSLFVVCPGTRVRLLSEKEIKSSNDSEVR